MWANMRMIDLYFEDTWRPNRDDIRMDEFTVF